MLSGDVAIMRFQGRILGKTDLGFVLNSIIHWLWLDHNYICDSSPVLLMIPRLTDSQNTT